MERRNLIVGAVASIAVSRAASAQLLPPEGFGTPLGTSPFAPDIFRARRSRLMAQMQGGMAVVYGAGRRAGGGFRQDGDFAYLTGIVDEPGAILILAPAERDFQEILLLPSRDIEVERRSFERLPLGAELERRTGFARILRTNGLDALVTKLAQRAKDLHFLGPLVSADAAVPAVLELYGRIRDRVPGCTLKDSSALLAAMRLVKEPRELELIRKATGATVSGHRAAMRNVRPGWTERQLQDALEAGFRTGGGEGLSYESIVGTGRNAASLHYIGGSATIAAGDLILIDAAASVGGYASDITRTFPASGRFDPEQRKLYELVLAAQAEAVSRLKAGAYLNDVSEAAKDVFRKAGRIDDFFHSIGHFVGLDVHDVGDTAEPIPAGAVITIEPGLYVQAENYGIRVEDIYLVTRGGCEILSGDVPRTVEEIEDFMAEGRT